MINDGPHKFTCACPTEQRVEINVADPPENERMRFTAKLGPAEKGDVEETRDVVRPEVGTVGFGSCNLIDEK